MTVGVGVVGLGFMGQTHVRAYQGAGARLVAVCDADAGQLAGEVGGAGNLGESGPERLFDPADLVATPSLEEFLAAPGLELVSVCTPTDTHVAVASATLRAGVHVLVEKPVALSPEPIEALAADAARAGRLCMPAMCMRFWPAWAWIADAVRDGRFGGVRTARFERLGAPPAWGRAFYEDESRSGGALFDLHVHDTDFVVHLFGAPECVVSVGDARHVSTTYVYPGGPAVTAQGGWMSAPGWAFRMRCTVEFERAVADFDLGRDPELRVFTADGATLTPELALGTGWDHEARAMIGCVASGGEVAPATLDEAGAVTRVLLAERESLRTGGPAPTGA